MNKYLVAHTLNDAAKNYCERISSELSEQFEVADPHRRIPAHFTLKSPFKANSERIESLNNYMYEFAGSHDGGIINLDSFGHFNKRVIYVNGTAENKARNTIDALTKMIKNIEWISLGKYDHDITLHATLARPETDTQFERIRTYLKNQHNPEITTEFDSISVLKLDTANDEWHACGEFKLQ